MDNLIDKFLRAGLLHEIGDDDQKLNFLSSAAKDLSGKLQKNQIDAVRFTLSGLDPEISLDDPSLGEAEVALTKHWKTLRHKFQDSPRQLLRAILLDAVNRRCDNNATAATVWLTGASVFPHLNVSHNERQLLAEFLISLRDKTEETAMQTWGLQDDSLISISDHPTFSINQIAPGKSNVKYLEENLQKAAGKDDKAGTALENANPYYPNAATYQWTAEFATRASKTIAAVIDSVNAKTVEAIQENIGEFKSNYEENIATLSESLQAVIEGLALGRTAEAMRGELLWWRQTLYSRTLKTSYRGLDAAQAAFAMAFDLHTVVGAFHPASVEFLLREAFYNVMGEKADEKFRIAALAENLTKSDDTKFRREALDGFYRNWLGQLPLTAVIKKKFENARESAGEIESQTIGRLFETEIAGDEFAVWIFRDLQAHRLATMKNASK
jgi:hypothetical protein